MFLYRVAGDTSNQPISIGSKTNTRDKSREKKQCASNGVRRSARIINLDSTPKGKSKETQVRRDGKRAINFDLVSLDSDEGNHSNENGDDIRKSKGKGIDSKRRKILSKPGRNDG